MRNSTAKFGIVASLLLTASSLQSQEPKACPVTFEDLVQRNWCELEQIYRQAKPGTPPTGFARGKVILGPCEPIASSKERMASLLWKGKLFCAEDSTLVNQWLGVRAPSTPGCSWGPSWLDGEPAIIFDHEGTSRILERCPRRDSRGRPGPVRGGHVSSPLPVPAAQAIFRPGEQFLLGQIRKVPIMNNTLRRYNHEIHERHEKKTMTATSSFFFVFFVYFVVNLSSLLPHQASPPIGPSG